MSKAKRLNQHDLTLNDYSFRIAAVSSSVDDLKDDRDSLERRVFALEKAIQNQDDTIQNEDVLFKVGDRVLVDSQSLDMAGVGRIVGTDFKDAYPFPFLVKFNDGDDAWFPADELRHADSGGSGQHDHTLRTAAPGQEALDVGGMRSTWRNEKASTCDSTKGDGVVVASLQKERDEARENAHDLAAALADSEANYLRLARAYQEQEAEWLLQLSRARSEQRIDPARAGLSQMGPFTYYPSSAEPAGVTRVTDSYGDVWVRDAGGSWSGDVGAIHEGYRDSWDEILDQYGPLTEQRNA